MYGYSELLQPTDISLEDLLSKVSEKDIFKLFIKEPIELDRKYVAPYREDKNADCYFQYFDNKLLFTDFASGDNIPTINCIGMVMKCLNLSYRESIDYVANYFSIKDKVYNRPNTILEKQIINYNYPLKIEISIRNYDLKDRKFWYKYGITKDQLLNDKVYPITAYRTNNIKTNKSYIINTLDLTYAFTNFSSGHIKIYRPYNKDFKWFTNCNQNDIGNINQLFITDQLVITKSYKDCRVLRNLGVNSIWFQNEGMSPSQGILKKLTTNFSEIFIFYDSDPSGISASQKIRQILNNIKPNISQSIFLPPIYYREKGVKDPSDFYVYKGREELINFIKSKNIKMYESIK